MVHSRHAQLLFLLFSLLKLASGSSSLEGQEAPRRPELLEAAWKEAGAAPAELWACDAAEPCWLDLAHRRAALVLSSRRGAEAVVVGAGGARTLGAAAGEGGAALAAGGGGGWPIKLRPADGGYGNLTVRHSASDLGTIAVRRTGSPHKAQILIPVVALITGSVLGVTRWWSLGLLLGYFGAQSGLSLYMKLVLSDASISRELGLKGVPAAFLITGAQQVVAFLAVSLLLAASWAANWRCDPHRLLSARQFAVVLCLSLAFAGNIGLNNFSLSLMAISLNLVIRSCLPLVTLAMHAVIGIFQPGAFPKVTWAETGLISTGVACAGLATLAELKNSRDVAGSQHMLLGVLVCFVSICAGSLDLILGKILGKHMGLNPLDTTWYMSLPAALALLPPGLLLEHPSDWPGVERTTDWEVLAKVVSLRPMVLVLVLLSGVFSVSYNVLRYAMVQQLSPAHTAFAGNFNKALTIVMSLMLGLEPVPVGMWGSVMLLSIAGSISAFMVYNFLAASDSAKVLREAGGRSPTGALRTEGAAAWGKRELAEQA